MACAPKDTLVCLKRFGRSFSDPLALIIRVAMARLCQCVTVAALTSEECSAQLPRPRQSCETLGTQVNS
jgi:hypothetical protein